MANVYAQYEQEVHQFFKENPHTDIADDFLKPGARFIPLFTKGPMTVVMSETGLIYSKYQPTQSVLSKFYSSSKPIRTWSEIKISDYEKLRQEQKFSEAVKYIIDNKYKSVLDLGCGNAFFLDLVKKTNPEINTMGVDTSLNAIAMAEKTGAQAVLSDIFSYIDKAEYTFDVVSCWGTLEHLKRPILFLNSVKKLIKKEGVLIVCVPNIASSMYSLIGKQASVFCPQHLWYFRPSQLIETLELCGYSNFSFYSIPNPTKHVAKKHLFLDPYEQYPEWVEVWAKKAEDVLEQQKQFLDPFDGEKMVFIAKVK